MKPRQIGGKDSTKWEVVVELGVDDLGVRRRKRKTFTANGAKAARKKADEITRRFTEVAMAGHKATVGGAVEAWWELHSPMLAASSLVSYRGLIDRHIAGTPLAAKPLLELTRADVRRLYADLAKSGRTGTPPKLAPILHGALELAVEDRLIPVNVAHRVPLPKHRKAEYERARVADIQAVLDAAGPGTPRGRALHFAALSGFRRGEVAALRWSRVDLEGGRVMGDRSIAIGPGGELVEKDTKAGTSRVLRLNEEGLDLLHDQLAWQMAEAEALGVARAADGFVWSVRPPFDELVSPRMIAGWWERAREQAGVSLRLHDLRHWAVSNALAAKVAPTDVQAMSRHQSLKLMLDTYGHPVAEASERAVSSLPLPEIEWGQDRASLPSPSPDDDDGVVDAEVVE